MQQTLDEQLYFIKSKKSNFERQEEDFESLRKRIEEELKTKTVLTPTLLQRLISRYDEIVVNFLIRKKKKIQKNLNNLINDDLDSFDISGAIGELQELDLVEIFLMNNNLIEVLRNFSFGLSNEISYETFLVAKANINTLKIYDDYRKFLIKKIDDIIMMHELMIENGVEVK